MWPVPVIHVLENHASRMAAIHHIAERHPVNSLIAGVDPSHWDFCVKAAKGLLILTRQITLRMKFAN